MPSYDFKVGQKYTRADVYRVCGVPLAKQKGEWHTGYRVYEGRHFIFCNIGGAGRTGDDHGNYFINEDLLWHGKSKSHIGQKSIINLTAAESEVFVFYRSNDRDPFTFAGLGKPETVKNTQPVEVLWSFTNIEESVRLPEEVSEQETFTEGAVKTITINAYERDPEARQKCVDHYGYVCVVCSFEFEKIYGELGKSFIHVHHLKPLGEIGEAYEVDPVKDLRPVCPNCHAMLHRKKTALSIEELKKHLKNK